MVEFFERTNSHIVPNHEENRDLLKFSHDLRAEQVIENDYTQNQSEGFVEGDILLFYHDKSSLAEKRYEQTLTYCEEGKSRSTIEEDLTGVNFEDVVKIYLPKLLTPNQISLSESKIQRLYQKMFPDKMLIQNSFNKIGMKNISIPDFVVIDQENMISIIGEASLVHEEKGIARMYKKYNKEFATNKYQRKNPLFASAQFWYIVPENFEGEEDPLIPDMKIKRLPFSYADLREITESLYLSANQEIIDQNNKVKLVEMDLRKRAIEEFKPLIRHGTYIANLIERYQPS